MRISKDKWPRAKPAKIHSTRQEILKLAERWDKLGACRLMPEKLKQWEEAVGVFAVGKDSRFDRLIVNPQCINSRMFTISDCTKTLAPGCMLSLLHLEPEEAYRFCADDLSDFYYTFLVSDARSQRNALRIKFKPSEVSHLSCFNPSIHGDSGKLLICLATLAMGDSLAVEAAQQAHTGVLHRLCGSMLNHEVLRYRYPLPRTPFIELLAIDDHVGLQKLDIHQLPGEPFLRDSLVFELAGKAYKQVGLVQHEKKRKRNLTKGVILGADFDGVKGRVMAPRSRIILLVQISIAIARGGCCTRQILQILLGCWIHVLLFRRAIFSVIDSLFSEGHSFQPSEVFCVSSQSRNELLILAALGPMAQSDLRAKYSSFLYCCDASPTGGAVVKAHIGKTACKELWRHTEQKGYYTKLLNPAGQILAEHGIDPESQELFQDHLLERSPQDHIPLQLSEGFIFDCIEIFRGEGNWSLAHQSLGLSTHDGVDVDGRRLRVGDLTKLHTFREVAALAMRGVVRDWHAGMVCVSFGTLRRPQVRSKAVPFGFNPQESFTAYHNRLAIRTAIVLILAIKSGAYISVEQPGSSRLFHLNLYKTLVLLGCVLVKFDFCSFGSPFQKPSKWLTNKPWLEPLSSRCHCPYKGNHFVVQGCFTHANLSEFSRRCKPNPREVFGREPKVGEAVASFSATYPLRLVSQMAAGSLRAKLGQPGSFSDQIVQSTLHELGLEASDRFPALASEASYGSRPWFEDPEWIGELSEGLEFKEMFRYKFAKPGHINVNESRTYKSLIKAAAKGERRFITLLDSRVTLGAAAKGRSSSYAISRVLQGSLGYLLGANLYPGGLHCYSKSNRADEPSRDKEVRPPSRPLPGWFLELQQGKYRGFDCVTSSSRVSKNPARWLRMLLMLSGDIEPNPGPVVRRPRGPMNLDVGFAPETSKQMKKCLETFQFWVINELQIEWLKLVGDPEGYAWALRSYGLHCFESGLPRYLFVYAITSSQDVYPQVKAFANIAWQIDRKWQAHEPGQCRAVLPSIALKACVALAAIWGWYSFLGVVLLGFAAMLHPSEIVQLVRKDLIFPSDIANEMSCLFIHVRNPKTARFARRQHGRVDDGGIIQIAFRLFGHLPLSEKLYVGSMSLFRKQWNAVMSHLGIPHRQEGRGATPAVLRGSGATFLYGCTENIPWIAWRGRWSRTRTLEFYLQEVAAQLLLHELPTFSKVRIEFLGKLSWPVLCQVLSLRGSTEEADDINLDVA